MEANIKIELKEGVDYVTKDLEGCLIVSHVSEDSKSSFKDFFNQLENYCGEPLTKKDEDLYTEENARFWVYVNPINLDLGTCKILAKT